ncbi:MAG: EamA family transporter, partial [Actinomycetales bacterium]
LYTVVGASLIGYTIFNGLMAKHPAGAVVPFILLVPPVGMLTAWLALDEVPDAVELAGGVLMMVGVGIAVTTFGPRRRPAPELTPEAAQV